jgi:hypothetical protein
MAVARDRKKLGRALDDSQEHSLGKGPDHDPA